MLHAAVFMLAAAWTLQLGGHVRVDIFYAEASARTKALVDLAGARCPAVAVHARVVLAVGAICRALVGDPRALAGSERAAARFRAQDLYPAVCGADGAARRRAGDPRRGGAVEGALMLPARKFSRS